MNLKEIRNMRGLSQIKLSDMSGVSRRTIEDLEKRGAEANPHFDTAYKLAQSLCVTVEELCLKLTQSEKFERAYNLLIQVSAYSELLEYAYDSGQVPCTIKDAEALLKNNAPYSVDEIGRVFTEGGVYIADMYVIDVL